MRSSRGFLDSSVPGYVIGGLGPILVAAALVPLRNELDNTNLALALVVVVVAAALAGGRGPAVVAAVVAAMSYDFFLTRPYLSLTIDSADDVETTIFLLVIGLLVGELVARVSGGPNAPPSAARQRWRGCIVWPSLRREAPRQTSSSTPCRRS